MRVTILSPWFSPLQLRQTHPRGTAQIIQAMSLFAEGILNTHWDQSVPVNLAHIAKAMGIAVAVGDTGAACAVLEISRQRKARITINATHSFMRQRYGVAHAMGHIALHHLRPGMRREIMVSESYHVDYSLRMESEANDFALRLLIPTQVLQFTLTEGHAESLQELAHLFEVPDILVKQRLADLDLRLPQSLVRQLRAETRWDA
jgi:Zn-dependent peptidase ImmA (M78 family)